MSRVACASLTMHLYINVTVLSTSHTCCAMVKGPHDGVIQAATVGKVPDSLASKFAKECCRIATGCIGSDLWSNTKAPAAAQPGLRVRQVMFSSCIPRTKTPRRYKSSLAEWRAWRKRCIQTPQRVLTPAQRAAHLWSPGRQHTASTGACECGHVIPARYDRAVVPMLRQWHTNQGLTVVDAHSLNCYKAFSASLS
jgi:hypothetical protein